MTVIPIRATLANSEVIFECLSGLYALETDPGNTVHIGWQDNAVPVNRTGHIQVVFDPKGHRFPLFPTKQRPGYTLINHSGTNIGAGEINGLIVNTEIEHFTTERR